MSYKMFLIAFLLPVCTVGLAQPQIPSYYKQSKAFNEQLRGIVHEVGLDSIFNAGEDGKEMISFAVIDMNGKKPVFGGVNYDNFIYPASVYKNVCGDGSAETG